MLALAHMPFKLQIYAKSLGYSNLTEIFSKVFKGFTSVIKGRWR